MLSITAVSAGAVDYLLRGSGCADHQHAARAAVAPGVESGVGRAGVEYLVGSAALEPAAVWFGEGLDMVGIEAGTQATEDQVRAVLGQLRHPDSTEEEPVFLGRPPRKFRSTSERITAALLAEPDADEERREQIGHTVRADGRKAVGYYDLTFSPVKSVSVYWAALMSQGRHEQAAEVVRAHQEAVAEAMAWAEREVAYTRVGYHGKTSQGTSVGRFEKATGLVWARWDHSTNRAREPQLHSHATVLNRVVTMSDGQVRALDGRGFKAIKQGIDAIYVAAYERKLSAWHGVVFAERPDGKAREIMGIEQRLCAAASTRHTEVVERTGQLVAEYVARHGRAPSPSALRSLTRSAALDTRAAKTHLSPGTQIQNWCAPRRAQLRAALEQVGEMGERVARYGHPDQRNHAHRTLDEVLEAAVERTQAQYATWTIGNLVDAIREELHRTPGVTDRRAEQLVNEVLKNSSRYGIASLSPADPGPVPAELRRDDGKCVYRMHHNERYATVTQLALETGLVALARSPGAPALGGPVLEVARVELDAAGLGADQAAAVLAVLTSGRAGDVLIGPAGSGKSHTMGVLADTWRRHTGGRVLGLATSQIATLELVDNGLEAMNTTRFVRQFTPDERGRRAQRVRPGDLVIIDEVGMSATAELAAIARVVAAGGGKVLYTGDHDQLASIEAGGLLKLLVCDNGCAELSEVHRFDQGWEAEASLRLRGGDTEVLELYEAHGRLVGGSVEELADAAVRGWLADTLAGRESLLVTASNEQARQLSAGIRAELVRLGRVSPQVLARTRDGNPIGVGDWVQARRNDFSLRVDGPGMVTNRVCYQVLGQDRWSGAMRVRSRDGVIAYLPAEYVAEHVTLAYAGTVYAAQGRTVDTCHALIDLGTSRRSAYVALSRGRASNTAYVVCEREPDAHQHERVDSTARAQLTRTLEWTDEAGTVAAELARRAGQVEGRELGWVGTQWDDITWEDAKQRYTIILAGLMTPGWHRALVAELGYQRLVRAVRAAELAGHDPAALLEEVVTSRALIGADSMSDVLRWRIRRDAGRRTPERHVTPGDWTALATPTPGPVGDYIAVLAAAATARQTELGQAAADQPPAWAIERLGEPPTGQRERAEWVHRAGVVAAYRELRGVPAESVSIGPAPAREQVLHRTLWQHAHTALGAPADELDYAMATDTELRAMREHYQRELTWAPHRVHEELRDAHLVATGYHQDAILWAAEARLLPDGSPARKVAENDVAAAHRLADHYDARVEHLQVIAGLREQWHLDPEDVRTRHVLAGKELTRRGLQPDPTSPAGEQTALFEVTEPAAGTTAREPRKLSPTAQARQAVEAALAATHGELHTVLEPGIPVDPDQGQLFATRAAARDAAAAQPLREPAAGAPTASGGQDGPITVAQARRHAEISAQLRAERDRWVTALEPAHTHLTQRDAAATEGREARLRREGAELHQRQVERVLGHDAAHDLDEDLGLGR